MFNCGMYQNDIAELRQDEVNWMKGTVTRARSKTRERNGPVVTYQTLARNIRAAEKAPGQGRRAGADHRRGKPARPYWLEEESARRYDVIQSAWTRLAGN